MKVHWIALVAVVALVSVSGNLAAQQAGWDLQGRPASYQDPTPASPDQDPPAPAQESPSDVASPATVAPMIDQGPAPGWLPFESDPMMTGGCYGQSAMSEFGPGSAEDVMEGGSAHVTVILPEAAKLFVNGDPTASTGETRYYVVKCLEHGKQYKFVFRAEMENAAKVKLEIIKNEMLTAGSSITLEFGGGVDACKGPWKKVKEEPKEGEGGAAPAPAGG
jgi:uncharacterized protein (TIGR03000 family)